MRLSLIEHPMNNQRGIAMLMALLIVVLMVTLIVEFDYGTRVSLTTAGTFRNGTQAMYLAKSGVSGARAILGEDNKISPGHDDLSELWATPVPPYPVGNGTVMVSITDESSKLNVNIFDKTDVDLEAWKLIWIRLFEILEIDTEVVGAIKDWVDVDDDPDQDLLGAESGYYESLDPPYTAKNGPIDSLGELLLIKGVTPIVYEKLTTACDGAPCLTIAPTKTINVNTVSIQVCQALNKDLTQEFCEDLETIRPLKNKSGKYFPGTWNIGIRTKLNNIIAVGSEYFFIRTIGEVQETQRVIEAMVHRKGTNTQLLTWRIR